MLCCLLAIAAVAAPPWQGDALYCHKCGREIQGKVQAQVCGPKDNFKLGLLLMKIGVALSALLPLLALAGITAFSGSAFLTNMPGMFAGILAVIFGMGALFAAIAFKFHNDIARGNGDRIVHALILAVAMFFLGSNIAGVVVGIGALLCYTSPKKMASATQ